MKGFVSEVFLTEGYSLGSLSVQGIQHSDDKEHDVISENAVLHWFIRVLDKKEHDVLFLNGGLTCFPTVLHVCP